MRYRDWATRLRTGPTEGAGLEGDQRPWQPRLRTIEKQPHAQGFRPLHGHQPHLPADMVAILEQGHLRFVLDGIPL